MVPSFVQGWYKAYYYDSRRLKFPEGEVIADEAVNKAFEENFAKHIHRMDKNFQITAEFVANFMRQSKMMKFYSPLYTLAALPEFYNANAQGDFFEKLVYAMSLLMGSCSVGIGAFVSATGVVNEIPVYTRNDSASVPVGVFPEQPFVLVGAIDSVPECRGMLPERTQGLSVLCKTSPFKISDEGVEVLLNAMQFIPNLKGRLAKAIMYVHTDHNTFEDMEVTAISRELPPFNIRNILEALPSVDTGENKYQTLLNYVDNVKPELSDKAKNYIENVKRWLTEAQFLDGLSAKKPLDNASYSVYDAEDMTKPTERLWSTEDLLDWIVSEYKVDKRAPIGYVIDWLRDEGDVFQFYYTGDEKERSEELDNFFSDAVTHIVDLMSDHPETTTLSDLLTAFMDHKPLATKQESLVAFLQDYQDYYTAKANLTIQDIIDGKSKHDYGKEDVMQMMLAGLDPQLTLEEISNGETEHKEYKYSSLAQLKAAGILTDECIAEIEDLQSQGRRPITEYPNKEAALLDYAKELVSEMLAIGMDPDLTITDVKADRTSHTRIPCSNFSELHKAVDLTGELATFIQNPELAVLQGMVSAGVDGDLTLQQLFTAASNSGEPVTLMHDNGELPSADEAPKAKEVEELRQLIEKANEQVNFYKQQCEEMHAKEMESRQRYNETMKKVTGYPVEVPEHEKKLQAELEQRDGEVKELQERLDLAIQQLQEARATSRGKTDDFGYDTGESILRAVRKGINENADLPFMESMAYRKKLVPIFYAFVRMLAFDPKKKDEAIKVLDELEGSLEPDVKHMVHEAIELLK